MDWYAFWADWFKPEYELREVPAFPFSDPSTLISL